MFAGGPDPLLLVATTEEVSGEKPVTVSDPDREGNLGREEGEGEQERV